MHKIISLVLFFVTQSYSECQRYNYNLSACTPGTFDCIRPYPPVPPQVVAINCDEGFHYDTGTYKETVVTEACVRGPNLIYFFCSSCW